MFFLLLSATPRNNTPQIWRCTRVNMCVIRLSIFPLCVGAHMCVYIGIAHMGSVSSGLICWKNINMIDGFLSLLIPGPIECATGIIQPQWSVLTFVCYRIQHTVCLRIKPYWKITLGLNRSWGQLVGGSASQSPQNVSYDLVTVRIWFPPKMMRTHEAFISIYSFNYLFKR